jgi:hypothetical protein
MLSCHDAPDWLDALEAHGRHVEKEIVMIGWWGGCLLTGVMSERMPTVGVAMASNSWPENITTPDCSGERRRIWWCNQTPCQSSAAILPQAWHALYISCQFRCHGAQAQHAKLRNLSGDLGTGLERDKKDVRGRGWG